MVQRKVVFISNGSQDYSIEIYERKNDLMDWVVCDINSVQDAVVLKRAINRTLTMQLKSNNEKGEQ